MTLAEVNDNGIDTGADGLLRQGVTQRPHPAGFAFIDIFSVGIKIDLNLDPWVQVEHPGLPSD